MSTYYDIYIHSSTGVHSTPRPPNPNLWAQNSTYNESQKRKILLGKIIFNSYNLIKPKLFTDQYQTTK